MPQDHTYPDPAQLRAWAREPMPFTAQEGPDLRHDGHLVAKADGDEHAIGRIEYDYSPGYIRFTPEEGEATTIEQMADATLDHAGCWTRADDIEMQEDFICATGITGDMVPQFGQFEAFWILETVTVTRLRD